MDLKKNDNHYYFKIENNVCYDCSLFIQSQLSFLFLLEKKTLPPALPLKDENIILISSHAEKQMSWGISLYTFPFKNIFPSKLIP